MITCPRCHSQIDEQARICPVCRQPLDLYQDTVVCPHCGARNRANEYICRKCNAVLIYRRTTEKLPWSHEVYSEVEKTVAEQVEGPYLVINPTGAIVGLPSGGQVNLGREDPIAGIYPDLNLTPFGAEKYGVSRRHARIILHDDRALIEDLGSLNGTFVNRRLLRPHIQYPVYEGDEIQLAGLTLTFHAGS